MDAASKTWPKVVAAVFVHLNDLKHSTGILLFACPVGVKGNLSLLDICFRGGAGRA